MPPLVFRKEVDRAPLLVVTLPGHATRTTQARWAAAPPAPRLLLLPSGPDRVHGIRSRRTRPSTQSHKHDSRQRTPQREPGSAEDLRCSTELRPIGPSASDDRTSSN